MLVLWPPDRKRSEIGVIPKDAVVQGCFWKKVCLLPDQIKPIEPLVPVN